jgi:hypothetical protein
VAVMQPDMAQQIRLELFQEFIVMADHLKIGLNIQSHAVFGKAIEDVAVACVLQHFFEGLAVAQLVDQLNMCQQLATATPETSCGEPSPAWPASRVGRRSLCDKCMRSRSGTLGAITLATSLVIRQGTLVMFAANPFNGLSPRQNMKAVRSSFSGSSSMKNAQHVSSVTLEECWKKLDARRRRTPRILRFLGLEPHQ